MKRINLLLAVLLLYGANAWSQGAKNIKINEVLTHNTASLQDGYGQHPAWIELANVSYSTYNVRGMYITTDRSVLDPTMSAPDRIARMSIIPNNEPKTSLSGRQHLVFFLNSQAAKGSLHLPVKAEAGAPVWIALYDGNGVDLIDSVSVPALKENCSYAREKDGSSIWVMKATDAVTPGIGNFIQVTETKVARLKKDDPYGFGITLLSMGIVFSCLALLFVFFTLFGIFMKNKKRIREILGLSRTQKKKIVGLDEEDARAFPNKSLERSKTYDRDIYIAVISMALKQYSDDVHDTESGVITIRPHNSKWHSV